MIDYAPIADCKHPELTYGQVCIKCDECGRFQEKPDFVVTIQSQYHPGIPGFWYSPHTVATFCGDRWIGQHRVLPKNCQIENAIPTIWEKRELPYVRWWIEGKSY